MWKHVQECQTHLKELGQLELDSLQLYLWLAEPGASDDVVVFLKSCADDASAKG